MNEYLHRKIENLQEQIDEIENLPAAKTYDEVVGRVHSQMGAEQIINAAVAMENDLTDEEKALIGAEALKQNADWAQFKAIKERIGISWNDFRNLAKAFSPEDFRKKPRLRESKNGNELLKELRMKKGLTQSQLAELADIPFKTYQSLENGRRELSTASAGKVLRLAKALGTSVESLLE